MGDNSQTDLIEDLHEIGYSKVDVSYYPLQGKKLGRRHEIFNQIETPVTGINIQ